MSTEWSHEAKTVFLNRMFLASKHAKISDDFFEPSCYTQAKSHLQWPLAMDNEYTALMKNGTWSLVPWSSHMNLVGCMIQLFRLFWV